MKALVSLFGAILCVTTYSQVSSKLQNIPANTWTLIDSASDQNMYNWSSMVYVPERGTALIWGGMTENHSCPNDVRYFDTSDAKWKSDYASTFWGDAALLSGACSLLANGRPKPALTFNAPYYDRVRQKVFYPLPGVMPAYDPASKTWADSRASVELYGKNFAGGPPVYWTGACYDPVNDEIVMFPHGGAANFDDWETTGRVSGHLGTFVYSFADTLWRRVTFTSLPVPGPRSSVPMVFDSANHAIVMFGGSRQDRMLNDTWIYDVTARQWVEQHPAVSPAPRCGHFMVYLPSAHLILMGGGTSDNGQQYTDLWTYDVQQVKWTHVRGDLPAFSTYWPEGDCFCTAVYLENLDLVLLLSTYIMPSVGQTMVFRFVAGDTLSPVAWTPKTEAPGISHVFPADQDSIVTRLHSMPANLWVAAMPPREPGLREWGNVAYDPILHCLAYYGGGHATYKGDDIELYFPGANQWIRSHTPNWCIYPQTNGYIGTSGVMFNGAPETQHQYQGYQALNGKIYVHLGIGAPCLYGPDLVINNAAWIAGNRQAIAVYDWANPGVWSWIIPQGLNQSMGAIFSDTAEGGRLVFYNNYWNDPSSWYKYSELLLNNDTLSRLSIRHAPTPAAVPPRFVGEHTQFYCAERNQFLAFGTPQSGGGPVQTWLFDVASNTWTNLNPSGTPPSAQMGELLYIADRDIVYGCPGGQSQGWLYSFQLNQWVAHVDQTPYTFWNQWTKIVYDTKFRILIMVPWQYSGGPQTYICRPEFPDSLVDTLFNAGIKKPASGTGLAEASLSVSPNPFNPRLAIRYSLPAASLAEVTVYGLNGRKIATLSSGPQATGKHAMSWNGTDDAGRSLGSGLYLVRLTTPGRTLLKSVALVK